MSKKDYKRPPIVVAEDEYDRLVGLAMSTLDRAPGAVDLFTELSRATVLADLPANAIGVGSLVTFNYDGTTYIDYELVDPHLGDIAQRRISVLTPVGAMLLGLSEGHSIEWVGPDSRVHKVRVESVRASVVKSFAS